MLEKIKICLTNNTYTDNLINLFIDDTTKEVKIYCNREDIDVELESIIRKIVIIKLNRINSEGLSSQSYSGVSESFIDGYPQDIIAVLNRKRKLKTL
ncbi:MAG: phage head-tail connector protein [Candidatus Onthovivens sp.]|nr:phage head-tail connector protein [Candidatus Onthovivens sp.]